MIRRWYQKIGAGWDPVSMWAWFAIALLYSLAIYFVWEWLN